MATVDCGVFFVDAPEKLRAVYKLDIFISALDGVEICPFYDVAALAGHI